MADQHSESPLFPRLHQLSRHALMPLRRQVGAFLEDVGDGWDTFREFRMTPAMDVVETDAGLEMTLELPGLTREDVGVTVEGDELCISAVKRAEHDAEDRSYRLLERTYGDVSRTISLPRSVDATKVSATLRDGVLKLVAPWRAERDTRTVPIRSL